MKAKILFVEDERDLALIVCDTLRQQGYEATAAFDGIEGLAKFRSGTIDLVIADVMMPRLDGFAMAREMRRSSAGIPIIFLTAKSTIDDVEQGFDIGANDYLKKPFELRKLLVRIKAQLRGKTGSRSENVVYDIGECRFDATNQTLSINGKEKEISNIEARILEKLASGIGMTVDASEQMIAVWQRDDSSNRNTLHGFIHKLPRIFRQSSGVNIVNQRGFGYKLTVKPIS